MRALARAIDEATMMVGAELYGVMSRALELTIMHMNTRVQFGKKIGSFQALQHRAVDLYMQMSLSRGAIDDALGVLQVNPGPAARAAASRVKSRCADAALVITREAIRLHGAIGLADECDIGLYTQRALALCAWLGNASEHRRRYCALAPFEADVVKASARYAVSGTGQRPADTDWGALSDEDFRHEVRAFSEGEYPEHLRYLQRRARWGEIKDWVLKLARKGWIAPAWPRDYGGMGLSPAKQVIMIEERERWGVARAPDQGTTHIGPVLIRYGTEEQKKTWLPGILSGQHVWCQGYSEPDVGSDLASLRTEAVADGDDFIINGTKIWTTLAHDATHMFLLARTDKNEKRQEGISFFLLDLTTPGVTIRPIRNIEGREEFCQEYFDNVRIPRRNLVGEVNQGWSVAKSRCLQALCGHAGPRQIAGSRHFDAQDMGY